MFDLVGYVEIFDVEVAGALAGKTFPVNLEPLGGFVVLVEASGACVPLGLDEEVDPYHTGHNVIHPDELSLRQAARIHFSFLAEVYSVAFSKQHRATSVTFEVEVKSKRCVDPPMDKAHICCIQCQAEAQDVFQIAEEPSYVRPIVFVRILGPRVEENKGCTRISLWLYDEEH